MSNDPSVRRLLPQNSQSQMNQFAFAPPAYSQPPRETQKNFVFVDEHNRHKRLKVMRACEGCRRRKIKCDAATTNTWPCSACIRLKLHCVRPNGQYEESPTDGQPYEPSRAEFEAAQAQETFRMQQQQAQQAQHAASLAGQPKTGLYSPPSSYADSGAMYSAVGYDNPSAQHGMQHYTTMSSPVGTMDQTYSAASMFPTPPMHQSSAPHSEPSPESFADPYGGQQQPDLSDLLGALKVDERGTAPYLSSKASLRNLKEEPAVEEADDFPVPLPPITLGPGHKIRIPPELMPDDETILHYFQLYFSEIHPYVPVLHKASLYHQWQHDRESVSPLLLEAIFAVAGRLADEPAQGQQWIALASKHADSFMDVPRLSTLQANLIILKAREAVPKRGYYYRSWMSVVQCVSMAKDLGLDEHHLDHQAGKPCGSTPAECLVKTRVWETIFVCETMIAASQGRDDLSVDLETLDFSSPRMVPGGDEREFHVSRNFRYLMRIVRNISRMNRVYTKIKRKKEWGIDPEFQQLNPSLVAWLDQLPADMVIQFPGDGSPPWLPSHFIGNLHSYYHLSIILCHRPQLSFLDPTNPDGSWKSHMMLSYSSAKSLCKIEESMLQSFGLSGLQCMQRGISFTIYAILACIVLHLVALTSPDPELNGDAREYFTRHMRILEKTKDLWPLPEMVKQIDALREAFSVDIRKPFMLKPSFPYGSPHPSAATPPRTTSFKPPMLRTTSLDPSSIDPQTGQHSQVSYMNHPITPISAGSVDTKSDSPAIQSLAMMSGQGTQAPPMPHGMALSEAPSAWNPSRLFDQWNTTFGTPQPPPPSDPMAPQTSSLSISSSSGAPEVPTTTDIQIATAALPPVMQTHQYSAPPTQTFVTPAMWQESVASVYEGGLKRAWDYDPNASIDATMAKRR